jgi:hypothetical protein
VNMPTTPCPHCHCAYTNNVLQRHMVICLARPEVYAATRAALDDGTGTIKPTKLYAKTHGNTPSDNALYDLVGSTRWRDVAAYFGLAFNLTRKPPTEDAPLSERTFTPIVAAGYSAMTHTEERITVCGLPVCRVIDYGQVVGFVLR